MYESNYEELRRAIIDYLAIGARPEEMRDAYRIILKHIRRDRVDAARLEDYDATLADFEAGAGRR